MFLYPYTVLELGAFRALRYEQMLLQVAQQPNAIDRLLGVVRWFLTSMERMENMSKKPFNPVLGEELNAWTETSASTGRTSLKAEQVSHHPPVSALVMRNDQHKVQFNSNVKFGITFNGNSVSCRLEGRAEVVLEQLQESYVAPNWVPDVIIQNVLFGTRRQLWSGEWSLQCKKTGLGVRLQVTEVNTNSGWLSAVKAGIYENRIEGFVYKLDDENETPIKVITGLAGRKIFVSDPHSDKQTLLIDCDEQVAEKIYFLPENARPANSSLVIWKATVAALVKDDTAAADKEKTIVETQQREIRKDRAARGEEWKPSYFTFDEELESWKPLPSALKLFATIPPGSGVTGTTSENNNNK